MLCDILDYSVYFYRIPVYMYYLLRRIYETPRGCGHGLFAAWWSVDNVDKLVNANPSTTPSVQPGTFSKQSSYVNVSKSDSSNEKR